MTGFLARNRTGAALVAAIVVVLLAVTWVQRDRATYDGPLDPRNPGPAGAQAVARVLADHDVDVSVVRGQRSFLDDRLDAGTAVVVSNADQLGASTLRRLREHAASRELVLVGSSSTLLKAYDLSVTGSASGLVASGCRTAVLHGLVARLREAPALTGTGCFREDGGVAIARPARGVWLVTAPELFRNDRVLEGDNAAVALRLLGQQRSVVWYVADPADTVAADAVSLGTFLPDWLVPGLWLVALTLVGFLLWRGRRLGRLVSEPLPVVVRAAESTESRGRLYRRTHDRDHVATILRAATRRRLANRLRLPDDTATTLVAALPEHRDMLLDHPVPDDAALAELGRSLARLEEQTR